MIGGNDFILKVRPEPSLKSFIFNYIKQMWPDYCVEWDSEQEVFVFKDCWCWGSWTEKGGTDENQDTMIHLIFGDRDVTMVVSPEPASQTAKMAAELNQNIRVNFHRFEITG